MTLQKLAEGRVRAPGKEDSADGGAIGSGKKQRWPPTWSWPGRARETFFLQADGG